MWNDGLKKGTNPNQKANELWRKIEQRIEQINKIAHESEHDEL